MVQIKMLKYVIADNLYLEDEAYEELVIPTPVRMN